jgi:hypothetical protein
LRATIVHNTVPLVLLPSVVFMSYGTKLRIDSPDSPVG